MDDRERGQISFEGLDGEEVAARLRTIGIDYSPEQLRDPENLPPLLATLLDPRRSVAAHTLPEAFVGALLRTLDESATSTELRRDPAFVHPTNGKLSDVIAAAIMSARHALAGDRFTDIDQLLGAAGQAGLDHLAQGFALGALGATVTARALSTPAWLEALRPDERRRVLPKLGSSKPDLLPHHEAIAIAREALATFEGGSEPGLASMLTSLGSDGLVELFATVAPRHAVALASIVVARRELEGGTLHSLAALEELEALRAPVDELKRAYFEPRSSTRIAIEGPSSVDIGTTAAFRAVLARGVAGGSWSWSVVPDAAATATAPPRNPSASALRYRAREPGVAAVVLAYTTPSGEIVRAIREVRNELPRPITEVIHGTTRIPRGGAMKLTILVEPPAALELELRDPENVVASLDPRSSTTSELHVVSIAVSEREGTFAVLAHRDNGPSLTIEMRSIDATTPQLVGPTQTRPRCTVAIVSGPVIMGVDQVGLYEADGQPEGGMYTWSVEPSDGATLVAAGRMAKVQPTRKGAVALFVAYELDGATALSSPYPVEIVGEAPDDPRDEPPPEIFGEEIDDDAGVALVRKLDPDREQPAVPLVQNVPNARLVAPEDTGDPISNNDFKVVAIKVLDEWEDATSPITFGMAAIDLSKLAPAVRIELKAKGRLWDTLELIEGMTVEVDNGLAFRFTPKEVWDTGFEKWYPSGGGENIRIEGLGVHHLRAIPQNAIGNQGRYHADVVFELTDDGARAVADAHQLLAEILAAPAHGAPPPDPAQIIARTQHVVSAWRGALWGCQVRSRHNVHHPHPVNVGKACQFRVRGFTESGTQGEIEAVPSVRKPITLAKDVTDRLLSVLPKPDFFVTLDAYPDTGPKNFVEDGLLRGRPNELGRGHYPLGGATDEEIAYGVSASGPRCVHTRSDEPIRLEARGTPMAWEELTGQYTWTMVSHPEGAIFKFAPEGTSTQPFTEVTVDRSGHYVARVDYVLDDPRYQCNQTYAIVDFQVALDHQAGLMLLRVGDYPPDLGVHTTRAFYRRRTLEPQEGADLLVHPVGAAHFGHACHFFVRVPPELELQPELTARVYTKADRSEWRDHAGAPAVVVGIAGRHTAEIHVQSLEPIYAVHLIRIRYRGLLELPGHAVVVQLEVLPPPACPQRILGDAELAGASSGAGFDGELLPPPNEPPIPPSAPILERVNLLLYEHDLGDAAASHAVVAPLPGADAFAIDVANGNLHYELALFTWKSRGLALWSSLHYNSFHAAQLEAVERMAEKNGISVEDREREWARTGPGLGWTHSFGMCLFDHVLSEAGNNIRKRLELVDATGNHIQLEATEPLGGTFRPVARGTLFDGDPEVGASLQIDELRDHDGALTGYLLSDLLRRSWRFDIEGRLLEANTIQTERSNGALAPIRLQYEPGRIVVTDSVARTLTVFVDDAHRIVRFETSNHRAWDLAHSGPRRGLLSAIVNPRVERIALAYDDFNFLTSFTGARGVETTFERVPSGDGWGRAKAARRADLSTTIEYAAILDAPEVEAHLTDPRGTRHHYIWNRDSLALRLHRYFQDEREYSLGVIDDEWLALEQLEYFDEPGLGTGKLPIRHLDLAGHAATRTYRAVEGGGGFQVETLAMNGTVLETRTYDRDTRQLFETTDHAGGVTTHLYDTWGNLQHQLRPRLAGQTDAERARLEWSYGADGRLAYERDASGGITTYGHGGDGDPHGVGLPTSRTRAGATWTLGYEASGVVQFSREPLYGGRTDYTYDALDRISSVLGPQIQVVFGSNELAAAPARAQTSFEYDANGNVTAVRKPLGRGSSATFDAHDRKLTEAGAGGTRVFEYDGGLAIVRETDPRGKTWRREHDALGRPLRIFHPARRDGQFVEDFRYATNTGEARVSYARGLVSASGRGLLPPARFNVEVRDPFGNIVSSRQWTTTASAARSPEAEWRYPRDAAGNSSGLVFSFGGSKRYEEIYELDAWFRLRSIQVGDAITRYELGARDEVIAITLPEHGAGALATWRFGYDGHLRPTTVRDPEQRLVREHVYTDASDSSPASMVIRGIPRDRALTDRFAHHGGTSRLDVIEATTFNAVGLPTRQRVLDFAPSEQYYDATGELVIHKQGHKHVSFSLDGAARRTVSTVRDRVTTIRTERRFDALGNVTFLSGAEFDTTYDYDAAGRLERETRDGREGRRVARELYYDALDRPVRRVLGGDTTVRITYDDARSKIRYDVVGVEAYGQRVEVDYHWNGSVALYKRFVDGRRVLSVIVDEPDRYGRSHRTTVTGTAGTLTATVRVDHWPAGTRKSLAVITPGRTLTQSSFRYYPDGQLASFTSAHGGQYAFRYHPSGALSSWTTPRGDEFAILRNAYARVSSIESRRAGVQPSDPVGGVISVFGPGHPEHAADRTSVVRIRHADDEEPDEGETVYSSTARYDASGLLEHLVHRRAGEGEPVEREITSAYAGGELRTITELHRFPDDADENFTVTKTYSGRSPNSRVQSRVAPEDDELVRRFHSMQTTRGDAYGRVQSMTTDALDPGVWTLFGDSRRWVRTRWSFHRDELGRVANGWLRLGSARHDDPRFRDYTPIPGEIDISYDRDHLGRIGARSVRVQTQRAGVPVELRDQRLFLYDNGELLAEVDEQGLVRAFQYGPGEDFRLDVFHRVEGSADPVLEHYLYGVGMSSAALLGTNGKITRWFGMLDMPIPGDDRLERPGSDDDEDRRVISTGSPLYVAAAEPSLGGIPPYVRTGDPLGVGTAFDGTPSRHALGILTPHRALVEDVFDPSVELVDGADLPVPTPLTTWEQIGKYLDWVLRNHPMFGMGYRMAQGAYEVMSKGDTSDKLLFLSNTIWMGIAARTGIPIDPIEPLVMAVSATDYTAADYALALFGIRDPIMRLNGYDPATGATYTWSERFDALGGLEITPLVELGEGCLPGDATIWTPDGRVAISDIWPGQHVIGGASGRSTLVSEIHARTSATLAIELDDGTLETTPSQPIFAVGRGFVRADQLATGDELIDAHAQRHAVRGVRAARSRTSVYNVTVTGDESYFAGELGILVHNKPAISNRGLRLAVHRARTKHAVANKPGTSAQQFMAEFLVKRGLADEVWRLDTVLPQGHFFRGQVAEHIGYILHYDKAGFGHVGSAIGGSFEWDFHRTNVVVSYKSLNLGKDATATQFRARIHQHIGAAAARKRRAYTTDASGNFVTLKRRELHVTMPAHVDLGDVASLYTHAKKRGIELHLKIGEF